MVNGLDRQPLASIAATIASLGFNCVRLPFSLEQYYDNPYIEVRTSQLALELETHTREVVQSQRRPLLICVSVPMDSFNQGKALDEAFSAVIVTLCEGSFRALY